MNPGVSRRAVIFRRPTTMRVLTTKNLPTCLALALLFSLPVTGFAEDELQAKPAAEAPSLDSLAWIAGHWHLEKDGRTSEEIWLAPAGGMMVGVNRDVRPGRSAFFEYLRIEEGAEDLTYWASPKGAPAVPFRLVEQGETRAVFSNPKHDFPQRILYWLDDGGRLHARAEATVDGKVQGSEWVWERVP